MSDLGNAHDKFFKEAFSRPEVVRDFLGQQLPPAVLAHIDLDTLAVGRRTPFCSRDILTSPLGNAVRNRGYSDFSDRLLELQKDTFVGPELAEHLTLNLMGWGRQ